MMWMILVLTNISLASCTNNKDQCIQDALLSNLKAPHKCFKQYPATQHNPPSFYTCDTSHGYTKKDYKC